eukprot:g48981.t1
MPRGVASTQRRRHVRASTPRKAARDEAKEKERAHIKSIDKWFGVYAIMLCYYAMLLCYAIMLCYYAMLLCYAIMLCYYAMLLCYAIMLCYYAMLLCYAIMLCYYAMLLCYAIMLCYYAMLLCYAIMLCYYAMLLCYAIMLCYYAMLLCYAIMLCYYAMLLCYAIMLCYYAMLLCYAIMLLPVSYLLSRLIYLGLLICSFFGLFVAYRAERAVFYGHYCGPWNGANFTVDPIDGLDALCQQHDRCIADKFPNETIPIRSHLNHVYGCGIMLCDLSFMEEVHDHRCDDMFSLCSLFNWIARKYHHHKILATHQAMNEGQNGIWGHPDCNQAKRNFSRYQAFKKSGVWEKAISTKPRGSTATKSRDTQAEQPHDNTRATQQPRDTIVTVTLPPRDTSTMDERQSQRSTNSRDTQAKQIT